jgi:branched-chain amino acid transport system permease protein
MELLFGYVDQVLIFVVFALSLNLLLGYTGQISVAHAAFGAIGGYTLAYLSLHSHVPAVAGVALGILFAGLAGFLVGVPALRLKAEWLILLTLSVQIIVNLSVATSRPLGGTYGLQDVTGLSFFEWPLVNPSDMALPFAVCALLVLAICWRLGESPYGRVLRGIREDEIACRSLGKRVFVYKLTAFSLSAALAGLAGAMLVVETEIAAPKQFLFDVSSAIVAMVVVGGSGSIFGPVVGVLLLSVLGPLLERVLNLGADAAFTWRLVAYGAALVAIVMLRPAGLVPDAMTRRLGGLLRRSDGTGATSASRQSAFEVSPLSVARTSPAAYGAAAPVASASGEAVVAVRGLSKHFGGIRAVENLTLELRSHSITALVGPNGAGKTTVFNLLTGAIRADGGTVELRGRDISGLPPDAVARLGMARSFQDVRIFPRLSALENVLLGIGNQPGEHLWPLFARPRLVAQAERAGKERAHEWLRFVGMAQQADVPAGALAFGEQKLVALARVLATEADVVLLDEPASGIDVHWVDAMLGLIDRLRTQGRTICLVEHNLHVVERLADRTCFMELGRITAQGSFAELTADRRLAEAYFGTGAGA